MTQHHNPAIDRGSSEVVRMRWRMTCGSGLLCFWAGIYGHFVTGPYAHLGIAAHLGMLVAGCALTLLVCWVQNTWAPHRLNQVLVMVMAIGLVVALADAGAAGAWSLEKALGLS